MMDCGIWSIVQPIATAVCPLVCHAGGDTQDQRCAAHRAAQIDRARLAACDAGAFINDDRRLARLRLRLRPVKAFLIH